MRSTSRGATRLARHSKDVRRSAQELDPFPAAQSSPAAFITATPDPPDGSLREDAASTGVSVRDLCAVVGPSKVQSVRSLRCFI